MADALDKSRRGGTRAAEGGGGPFAGRLVFTAEAVSKWVGGPALLDFRRIRWVKSVSLDEDVMNYGGEDPTVRAREPKTVGDAFELHATPEDGESLGAPEVGDWIVLTQQGLATHLVEVKGGKVESRKKRTMRPGTRDWRFSVERTCILIARCDFETASPIEVAFGFEPKALGGEVFPITELEESEEERQPMWMLQRRIAMAFEPKRTPRRRASSAKADRIQEIDPGPGRVRRRPVRTRT